MIECICIDDTNKPNDIPLSKWIKKGEKYHVTDVKACITQNVFGFTLHEKPLDNTCFPYQHFISTRFQFEKDNVQKLAAMIVEIFNKQSSVPKNNINELELQTA